MAHLVEIDSVEICDIIDNELDPISPVRIDGLQLIGQFGGSAFGDIDPTIGLPRGNARYEMKMGKICCGAHGLSLMVTATKDDVKHTLLFDTGPEEEGWERNFGRLGLQADNIERIVLSHWHRDHSGGMLRAIGIINSANKTGQELVVDLHPNRPTFRGLQTPHGPISLEADPTFDEIESAGAVVSRNSEVHAVLDSKFLISGHIPRATAYEKGIPMGLRFEPGTETWEEDRLIEDERFMMCAVKGKGLVVFTGCGHAGVVNTLKAAIDLGGGRPLYCVVGGFHLADADSKKLADTMSDLKKLQPQILMPGHCSGWRIKHLIETEMPGRVAPLTVGSIYRL